MTHSVDIAEAFVALRGGDVLGVPGTALEELGRELRKFAASGQSHPEPAAGASVYIGGWPSANFWAINGDFLMSVLLYGGRVIVNDPLVDWFSDEQYSIPHLMAARPGYRHPERDATENARATRSFLANVMPGLQAFRPLLDKGVMLMVPTERHFSAAATRIDASASSLATALGEPYRHVRQFRPSELASENNVRGHFVLAPAPLEEQAPRALEHALRHFSREYHLASAYGAAYISPFRHESYLCRAGVDRVLPSSASVARALLHSEMPIFHGLTPDIISKVHDDPTFAAFRADLQQIYGATPVDASPEDVRTYLRDQEQVLLAPKLERVARESSSGFLARLGVEILEDRYRMVSSLALGLGADLALGTAGAATGVAVAKSVGEATISSALAARKTHNVWTSLVAHGTKPIQQLANAVAAPGSSNGWDTTGLGGMQVGVTEGTMIWDSVSPEVARRASATSRENPPYQVCPCGSGRKFKFCCYGLR
ncbi:MAG: hypothetical protein HGA44_09410 [Cellulomonadaceae bacterium]|nr:hypothetical protein [Cellulomonadaceae bacterium]